VAVPPINEQEFLKRLGLLAAPKVSGTINKTQTGQPNAPTAFGLQGLIDRKKTVDSPNLGLKLLGTVLKPLTVLDTPRRAIISGIRETVDMLDSDPNTNASWGDFKKQTMDASYGFGTAFPMKGFMGKVIGFAGDVLFDPLTYATLGSTVAKKAVMSTGQSTRAALGGVKNVSGRQGRSALAKLSKERLNDLAAKGMKFEKGQIDGIVKDIYAQGKKAMPGFLKDDIGIKGPGIYYLGSRVKVKGSGAIGDFIERKLVSTRLSLVSPKFKLNPGQYIHRAITPDGTFLLAKVEPEKILEYRVGLANGTLDPKTAALAAGVLEQHDSQRLIGAKALEKVTQGGNDVVADPAMESNKLGLHNIIERGEDVGPDDKRFFLLQKTRKFFQDFGLDIQDDFNSIPTGAAPQRLRNNYVPHMESDTTIVNKAKVGEDVWARSVGEVRIGDTQRNASSFRGRKYKKGDLFFGYILDGDKTIDEMNAMARKPGLELNPDTGKRFDAIDYDYYETDMTKIVNKYSRHYSQQKGYAAWLRTGFAKGDSYMRALDREIPLGEEFAMERAAALPKKLATVGPIVDDIITPLSPTARMSAPLAPTTVVLTPLEVSREASVASQELLQATQAKVAGLGKVLNEVADEWEISSPLAYQNLLNTYEELSDRLSSQMSGNYIERLVEDVGSDAIFIEKFAQDMEKFGRDVLEVMKMGEYVPKPEISQVRFPSWYTQNSAGFSSVTLAVGGDVKSVNQLDGTLSKLRNRIVSKLSDARKNRFIQEIVDKPSRVAGVAGSESEALRLREQATKNFRARLARQSPLANRWRVATEAVEKAQEVGVLGSRSSKIGGALDKTVYSADELFNMDDFQYVDSIVSPQQKAERTVRAGFEIENTIHYSESLTEIDEVIDTIQKRNLNIVLGDDYIQEVLQRNVQPFLRNASIELTQTQDRIIKLQALKASGVNLKTVSKQIDEIMGGKNVVSDFLERNYQLNPFIPVDPKIPYPNQRSIISLKDIGKELTEKDINKFLTLHLGDGTNDGILGAKTKLYQIRKDQLSNTAFNKEIIQDLFPVHTVKSTKELSDEVALRPAVAKHNKNTKLGPSTNVRAVRQRELEGLPKTLKDEFSSYIGGHKKKAAEFYRRIREEILPKARQAEKELAEFQAQHQTASAAWINDVIKATDSVQGGRTLNVQERLQYRVNKHFPNAKGFFDSFVQENQNTFNFIADIEQTGKTGIMSDWDYRIGLSILERNYSNKQNTGIFNKKKFDKIFNQFLKNPTDINVTYEQFIDITTHTLGVKFFDDIDNMVIPTLIDLESRVAAQHDYILRLTSRAIVSEKEVLNATPNNVFQKNRNRLAPFVGEEVDEATVKLVDQETGELTSFPKAQAKQNELEQSDFYPFAKSQEKRANTLLALKDFDGEKIDWTLNGRTQLPFNGQPMVINPQRWSELVNVKDLSSAPGDEVDYILSWLKQDDVKRIVLGEDFAKSGTSISDEQMLDKFVSYMYKNQPDTLASNARRESRNNFITNAWNKSDANKILTEVSRLKKLVGDDLARKQAEDPVRAIDAMLSESTDIITRRTAEGVRADEWVNAYGVDTSKEVEELIRLRQQVNDEFISEYEPYTQFNRPQKTDQEYLDLIKSGIPRDILDGGLSDLNFWVLQNSKEAFGLVAKTKLKEDFVDNLLVATSDELVQRSEKQLLQEIEILETLRTQKIDTPKTQGKINRMIRERRRILDTRSPAEKEAALAQVKKDIEEARLKGTNMLPGGREQIQRMVTPPADPEYVGADIVGRPGDVFYNETAGPSIAEPFASMQPDTEKLANKLYTPGTDLPVLPFNSKFISQRTVAPQEISSVTASTQRALPTVEPRYDYNPLESNIGKTALTNANPQVSTRNVVEYNPNTSYAEQFANTAPITAVVPETQIPIVISKNISETLSQILELPTPSKMVAGQNIVNDALTRKFESAYVGVNDALSKAKLDAVTKSGKAPLAVDDARVDTAALEQINNAKEVLEKVGRTGDATPVERILIDIGVKQAEILDTVSKLPVEEVEARLLDGMSSMVKPISATYPDGTIIELPFPDATTTIRETMLDGWTRLSEQFPNVQVTREFKEIYDNARYFEDPVYMKALTNYLGGFTKFHKAYATLTPGFHVRNLIGNTFQYVLAGGKLENLKPATKIHFDWLAAYKEGKTWKEFLDTLDPADVEAATVGRNAMLGSGGGIYGDVFHEVVRGNKIYDNRVTRFSRKYGQMSDNMSRFVLGFDSAKQGMNSDMATARVRKFYFDYEDLSKLDRAAKQFIPFWIWSSRNLPLQLENMWLNPKPYALYNTFKRNIRDKESEQRSPLPAFLQEVEAFKLPGIDAYAAPDLNFTRIQQQLSQLANPKKFGTNLNPLFRIPIEQTIKQNLYNDEAIETSRDRLVNALQGLVVPVATGDRLLNSYGDAKINAWLGVFGVPVRKIKEKQ